MAFYIEDIDRKCHCGCGRRANVELKTSGSMSYGYYNRSCGEREARKRNAEIEAKYKQT